MVNFLENDFVPKNVLVQIPAGAVYSFVAMGKRFPNLLDIVPMYQKYGFTARYLGGLGNFIIGVIGKQRIIGIFSPGAQAAIAGNEHPVVGVADDAHKKGAERVAVRDFEIAVGTYLSVLQIHFSELVNLFVNFDVVHQHGLWERGLVCGKAYIVAANSHVQEDKEGLVIDPFSG